MIRKIQRIFFLFIILILSLTACQSQKKEAKGITGIPIDTEKTESVSIYYGSICYSFYDESRETIEMAADLFASL